MKKLFDTTIQKLIWVGYVIYLIHIVTSGQKIGCYQTTDLPGYRAIYYWKCDFNIVLTTAVVFVLAFVFSKKNDNKSS
jgi:hypothetical protein